MLENIVKDLAVSSYALDRLFFFDNIGLRKSLIELCFLFHTDLLCMLVDIQAVRTPKMALTAVCLAPFVAAGCAL